MTFNPERSSTRPRSRISAARSMGGRGGLAVGGGGIGLVIALV